VHPGSKSAARAAAVLLVSVSYLCFIFQAFGEDIRTSGLGDWMDPYFINALLEHWSRSALNLTDPASPPMFFPVRHTLGYSHALVLYAPFYIPVRLFTHPFHAHTLALFAVIETGILCLYLIFHRFLKLSFLESLLLTAFFFTSQNVIGRATGIWSQRASVFLIPAILLILLASLRMQSTRRGVFLAWLSGLLAVLLFAHDFYTAHLAVFLAALPAAAILVRRRHDATAFVRSVWNTFGRGELLALGAALLLGVWTLYVWVTGGGGVEVLGLPVRSRDWRRPLLLAIVSAAAFAWLRGRGRFAADVRAAGPWTLAFGIGIVMGMAAFLWIYLASYLEHQTFNEEDLIKALAPRDLSKLRDPVAFLRAFPPFDTARAFLLVFAAALLAWMPWFGLPRRTRIRTLAFALASLLVLVLPVSFSGFSLWRTFLAPLPGFGVIRDPKRIIYVFELAAVLGIGLLMTSVPRASAYRIAVAVLAAGLLVGKTHREVFEYRRPIEVYERWVSSPLQIDPSCESFYTRAAPQEYRSRSDNMWTLYGIDSLFVALEVSMPSLNGYSAWYPKGWELFDPGEAVYSERIAKWIEQHGLRNVCELDVEARTIRPAESAGR
jgi:hypothetical protein